jgi:hypothetical protein
MNECMHPYPNRHLPGGVLYDLYGPRPRSNAYASSDDEDDEGRIAEADAMDASAPGGRKGRRRRPRPREGEGEGGVVIKPWRVTVRFHDIPLDQVRSGWFDDRVV